MRERVRRQSDLNARHCMDKTIVQMNNLIQRYDETHRPWAKVETRLDKFINHDKLREQ